MDGSRRQGLKYVAFQGRALHVFDRVQHGGVEQIDAGVDDAGARDVQVFFRERQHPALGRDVDAPIGGGVQDLGAQDRGVGSRLPVGVGENAKIGAGEAVAVHHQDRVGVNFRDDETECAGGAERLGLDGDDDVNIRRRVVFQVRRHLPGQMAESQYQPPGAKIPQPGYQDIEEGMAADGRQQLRRIAEGIPDSCAQSTGEDDDVDIVQAGTGNGHAIGSRNWHAGESDSP